MLWQVADLAVCEIVQRHRSHPLCLWQAVGGCLISQARARFHIPSCLSTGRVVLAYFGRWPISRA